MTEQLVDFKNESEIRMSNQLLRAAHSLSLNEKRLVMLGVSTLRNDNKEKITIDALDFANQYQIDHKNAYRDLKSASRTLYQKNIIFKCVDGDGDGEMRWLSKNTYKPKAGTVELIFNNEVLLHLMNLENNFTKYYLSAASGFKSKYTWRIFELLMQFRTKGLLTIFIEDFHHALDTTESIRKDFGNLNNRVIKPALAEINQKTGLNVAAPEFEHAGRKVSKLTFKFNNKGFELLANAAMTNKDALSQESVEKELTAAQLLGMAKGLVKKASRDAHVPDHVVDGINKAINSIK